MKLQNIVIQVTFLVLSCDFGEGQESKRFRIFLDQNERILIPKSSKIEILNPLLLYNKNYRKTPYKYHKKPLKFGKPPIHSPDYPPIHNPSYDFDLTDSPFTSFGDINDITAAHLPTTCCENVNQEEVIHPDIIVGGGGHSSTSGQFHSGEDDVKPVEEHIEDDIKYDFRTKIHSIR